MLVHVRLKDFWGRSSVLAQAELVYPRPQFVLVVYAESQEEGYIQEIWRDEGGGLYA